VYEIIGLGLLVLSSLLLFTGLFWLIRMAWRQRTSIGLLTTLTFPIGPLVFGLRHYQKCLRPLLLVTSGLILGAVPFTYDRLHESLVGLGERERIIAGERHLVLTGWDRPDYEILKSRQDVVVLEMANPNVTDVTLKLLLPLTKLKELTLNDSAVTDAGFETLQQLESLESVRLARTKITKDGVTSFLASPPPKLIAIDVSGNSIPASALRKWKNQAPETRRYVN